MDQHSSDRQASQASGARGRNRNANRRWGGLQDLLAKAGLGGFEDPSVTTDQADYGPGETAVITAKGFKRGDRINFAIADDPQDPGDDGEADVYAPFSVRDGSSEDGDGTINGQVVAKWIVPRDNNGSGAGSPDALNATLHLKAKGSHGAAATTSFTDSTVDAAAGTTELADPPLDPPVPAVSLDQSDYEPGETATITASGFALGSAVAFAIADDPDQPGDDGEADVYVPFAISDGSADDLDGLANGEVVTTWVMPADGNAALNVTAMGAEGESASASATISAATVAAATNPLAPTVSTDQSDYAPNETATITASGFTPGSSVEFGVEIVSDPGGDGVFGTSDDVVDLAATQLLAETPWLVVDGSAADLDPAEGLIQTTWLVDPDALNRTLRLTARGFGPDGVKATLDDEVATTSFTDAQGSFSKPYAHWSDEPLPGDWNNNILNDNKSNYFEGEVIPHVFMYGASNNAQLVNGQSYSFNVTYNWYQQNTDAGGFAYMTQYDLSRQPNVFDWATPAITPTADVAFTNDGGMVGGSNFYTVDADITSVSAVSYTGTGTKDGHVTLTFTYTGITTRNGYAAIYYGLYVAKPGEVPDQGSGKTNGANAWSGGSLQTTVDIGGSGATSLQLAPSAIIPGEISGLKFNDLNGNGTKDTGELGLAGWTICLDSDSDPNNGDLGCVQTANGTTDDLDGNGVTDPVGFYYFSVTPGTYYVREVNQAGWTQTAPIPGSFGPLTVSATTPTYLNQNFGNRQIFKISGTKYTDANGDGLTIGDSGLGGVTIFIDANGNLANDDGAANQTITAADGTWSFTNLGTGYAGKKVYEVLPSGYVQTLGAAGYAISGTSGSDQSGLDFANFKTFKISGTKYTDANGDGLTIGDSGLGGVTIFIDANGNLANDDGAANQTITAADGTWSFTNLGTGYAGKKVYEVLPSGYVQTLGAAGYAISGTSGSDQSGLDFANFELFDISGYKFIDIVGDGVWGLVDPLDPESDKDPGEKGWTINLSVDTDNSGTLSVGDALIRSDVTDETGQYQFTGLGPLEPGQQYIVWESPFAEGDTALDWNQTFSAPGYYLFDPVSGQSSAGVEGSSVLDADGEGDGKGNFGNFKNLDLGCYKWIDTNGNGAWDEGEAGANGWNIYLDDDDDLLNGVIRTVTTKTEAGTGYEGFYEFQNITPEEIGGALTLYVYEEIRAGFVKTFGGYTFDVQSGEIVRSDYGIAQTGNFGNFELFDISGTKYTDANGDGLTIGDSGLGGVTIFIDANGNLANDDGAANQTITAADGTWSFTNLGTGYAGKKVYEVLPSGYVQTLGAAGYAISGTSGSDQSGLDFANFKTFKISGTKYTDANGDGLTIGDSGLGGVTIFIDANGNLANDDGAANQTITAADGTWSFTNLGTGYAGKKVYEVLPSGYVQTLGAAGYAISGTSGSDQSGLDFANFKTFKISGTKYTDANGDGLTIGDSGLGGVTIFIDANGNLANDDGAANQTITAADGTWSFTNLGTGYAGKKVYEVLPSGYVQTLGAAGYAISGTSGSDQSGLDFANFELFDISGYKFIDIVGDGVWGLVDPLDPESDKDPGEKGWIINLSVDTDNSGTLSVGDALIRSDVTDETGQYQFTGLGPLEPGQQYIVWESPFAEGDTALDWTQTFSAPGYYLFDPVSGQSSAGVEGSSVLDADGEGDGKGNFGNFKNLDLGCYKWIDTNGNGAWDEGEAGANGWNIYLDDDDDLLNGVIRTVTTKTEAGTGYEGFYEFQNITPEEIGGALTLYVYEEIRAGFVKTFGGYTFDVQSGEIVRSDYGIAQTGNFGNFELFDISGTKYTDANGDGLTIGDSGLGGVTIFIDANGNLANDDGAANQTITAADGTWSFTNLGTGYAGKKVYEVLPSGYVQTLGAAGYAISGTSGSDQSGLDFANFELFDISGAKFNDLNADGKRGDGEIGLGDVAIYIDNDESGTLTTGDLSTKTALDGTWSFSNLDYTMAGKQVYEVLPSGYAQTLGMAGYEIIGTSGADQRGLDFGNVRVGACGLTPGFWLGGAANPKVKGVTTSIWDGVAYNDGGKLATLRGTIRDVVIDKYGDVLLTPEFLNKNVVRRQGPGPNGVYQADDSTKSVSADFVLGLNGSLRNFGGDSRLDQIYIEHFDARQILGTKYQPGDRFGALLRKDLAMILDVAGQQDYAQVAELRNAIYDWVGSCAFSASKNFVGPSGQGILTELGDVNQDGVDDWVINYQAAVGKNGSGFGADGKFMVSGSSASWTTGGNALPMPPSSPESTYAGRLLFDVLSAQFEGSCNLDVTLDGSRVLTTGSDGLTNGIYDNNGNLSMIASTLPTYGI